MADPRTPDLAPGMLSLCEDAQKLQAVFPPPVIEKSGSWRPAPWDCGPASAWIADGMPRVTT